MTSPSTPPPSLASERLAPKRLAWLERLALWLALLVPVTIDPWANDHQLAKGVMLGAAGALALVSEALARTPRRGPWTWSERWLALFAFWALVSAIWAPNAPFAWSRAALAIGTLGVLRVARSAALAGRTRSTVLAMLALGAVAMVIDGALVLQGKASGAFDPSAAKFSSGLFVHNNLAAGYVTLLAPLAVAMFAASKLGSMHRTLRVTGVVALVGLVAYLIILRSRGGLLGAALGVGVTSVLLVLRGRLASWERPTGWIRAVGVVAVAMIAVLPFSEQARGTAKDTFYKAVELTGQDPYDVQRRPVLWAKSMRMVHDHPVRGVGAGNFPVMLPRYDRLIVELPHAHNDALQVFTELGVVGLALFIAWLVAAAGQVGTALVRGAREGRGRALAAGAAGMLVVFVVSGIFETPWRLGATASTVALLLGLINGRVAPDAPQTTGRGARVLLLAAALVTLGSATVRVTGLVLHERAEQAAARGDLASAVDSLRSLTNLPLGSHYPHSQLAALEQSAGDFEAALVHRQAASALWPYGAAVLEGEGEVLFELGRYDEALEVLERALDTSPGRSELKLKIAFALDRAGRRMGAIELFESEVQRARGADTAVVHQLARLWQVEAEARRALDPNSLESVEAVVAARHFYAKVLEDGPRSLYDLSLAPFEYLTDILQQRDGSPDSWFKEVYQPWRVQHGWLHFPGPALYTTLEGDVRKLYPGWEEPLGPPRPPAMRTSP